VPESAGSDIEMEMVDSEGKAAQLSLGPLKPKAIMPKCNYVMPGLLRIIGDWKPEELANLVAVFSKGLPPANLDVEELKAQIQDHFHYAYNHALRLAVSAWGRNAVRASRNLGRKVFARLAKRSSYEAVPYVRRHLLGRKVDYPFLVKAVSRALRVHESDLNPENPDDLRRLEMYISQRVIVTALDRMPAKQRYEFFSQAVDPRDVAVPRNRIREVQDLVAPFVLLAKANSAGAGLAATASTALGFVTHAAGLTLPYVVQGMASTVAFTLGPAGWLGAGLWAGLRLTRPNWRKLSGAIIYIAAVRAAKELEAAQA
jgi:hypothetical protein